MKERQGSLTPSQRRLSDTCEQESAPWNVIPQVLKRKPSAANHSHGFYVAVRGRPAVAEDSLNACLEMPAEQNPLVPPSASVFQ